MPISPDRASQKKFFLTGATGLVGSYLLKVLLSKNHIVYALCRAKKGVSARARLEERLRFWDTHVSIDNLNLVEGDISLPGLGIDKFLRSKIAGEVDEIIHCAAITDLNRPQDEIERVNVGGTRAVLDFALECKTAKKSIKVNHISTAYVYGDYTGEFTEKDLDVGQKFRTTYEASKFKAEQVVEEYRNRGLWIDIYRPPIVVGESTTGKTFQLKHIYQFLNLCKLELFDSLPVKGGLLCLVPVDILAEALYVLISAAQERNCRYHPFPERLVPIEEIMDEGSEILGFKIPRLVPLDSFDQKGLTPAQKAILQGIVLSVNFRGRLNSKLTNGCLNKMGLNSIKMERAVVKKIIAGFANRRGN